MAASVPPDPSDPAREPAEQGPADSGRGEARPAGPPTPNGTPAAGNAARRRVAKPAAKSGAASAEKAAGDAAAENSSGTASARRAKTPRRLAVPRELIWGRQWTRERLWKELRLLAPGWIVSFLFHSGLCLILALMLLQQPDAELPIEIVSGWNSEQPVARPAAKVPLEVTTTVKTEQPQTETVVRKTKKAVKKADGPPAPVSRKPLEVDVSGAMRLRSSQMKQHLRETGGTDDRREQAVARALDWFKRVRRPDGHWQLHAKNGKEDTDPGYPDGGVIKSDVGATAMALMAYLGAGQTHQEGAYQKELQKSLAWLLKQQQSDGLIYERPLDGPAPLYSHAQATIVLGEFYALTHDEKLAGPLQKALAYIHQAQNPETGGWKYRPRVPGGDLSMLGWQMMALQTGRIAGSDPPPEVLDRTLVFLSRVEEQDGALYRYDETPKPPVSPAMTALGLLCREYLGWPANHPALKIGVQYLRQDEYAPRWEPGRRNLYAWYCTSQVLHHLNNNDWKEWDTAVTAAILPRQSMGGRTTGGSWDPFKPEGHLDERAAEGGRLYVTALSVLILQTPYRHEPLYQSTETASAVPVNE